MDYLEDEIEPLQFWNGYEQLLSDVRKYDDIRFEFFMAIILSITVITYITGIFSICTVFGKHDNISKGFELFLPLPYLSIQLSDHDTKFNSTNSPLLAGIESGCSVFIVTQSATLDFLEVFVELHDKAGYRRSRKYVLVLVDSAQSEDFLDSVRTHPSLLEILNFLIFRPFFELSTVDFLTNRFIGSAEYASELYLLDRYHVGDGSFQYGSWLFPDKTIDLYGKSIRVATFYINPHMLIKEAEATTPVIRSKNRTFSMDGFDGLILVEFCRKRNCSIELVIDKVNMWGVIFPNGTGNGIIGDVAERRADLGTAALSSWYRCYKYLTFSTPISRGSVTCLVPRPNHIPGWKLISMAFTASTYLTLCCTFCTVVAVYMLIGHFMVRKTLQRRSIIWNAFNVLAIVLLQPANIRHRTASGSIMTLALLLYVMNMGSIYSGKYASLRTIPMYEPAINTLNDLADSGMHWLQTHKAWTFSLLLSKNPTIMKFVSNFRAYPPSELHRIADQGGAAFALSNLNIGHLMLGDWITASNIHKYRLMVEELYHEHEVAMGTKTWPLMERFNEVISGMVSGRLLHAQTLRIAFQYDDYYVQTVALNAHEQDVNDPKVLGVDDILGGLIVLGFGLLCAGVVFVLEVMFWRRSGGLA